MSYIIAAFRSRTVAIKVYNQLTKSGVTAALVSTPQSANVGCGLSVKIAVSDYARVFSLLSTAESFAGFFRVSIIGGKSIVTRV